MIFVQLAAMLMTVGQPIPNAVAGIPATNQGDALTRREGFSRLNVPPVLMASFFPYMRCLGASRGIEQHMNGQVLPPLEGMSIGSDCSSYRSRTIELAHQALLRQQVTNVAERNGIIERTLEEVEQHFDHRASAASGGDPGDGANEVEPATPTRTETFVQLSRFDIPDEFVPAAIPYLNCVSFSAGLPVRSNGRLIEPTVAEGASCSLEREKSARKLEAILKRKGELTENERNVRVETFLREVDRRYGVPRPKVESFTVSSEIAAEIKPYITCRLSHAPCVSERLTATADAEAALVRKGTLSPDERAALIARTFDGIDAIVPVKPSHLEE